MFEFVKEMLILGGIALGTLFFAIGTFLLAAWAVERCRRRTRIEF